MKLQHIYFFLILFSIHTADLAAQRLNRIDTSLVQFSGLVLDGTDQNLFPVPYTNILVVGKARGTYSDLKGFFSIVVEKGDTIEFSAVGYKTVQYAIPMDMQDNRYSMVQLMTQDLINLPETVVFPWPSREHFKLEFLAMDVTPELQTIAAQNVAEETLRQIRKDLPYDGTENSSYYLRQQARQNYYIGQRPPTNIFSPLGWKQFFDAWKRGDFKNKDQ
jgi:hypothetical protein